MTTPTETTTTGLSLQERVSVLKALADGSRLLIVNALAERPHCVEELARRLDLSPPTISFHLRKLEEAGLLDKSPAQYYMVYTLRGERLSRSLGDLVRQAPSESQAQREERRLRQYRERVLRSFFRGGKLTQLPKQWKKQRLVAEALVEDFEPGRAYSEQEVSERIARRYADYCTIRRLLVEEGLMTRTAGRYRRVEERPLTQQPPAPPKKEAKVITPRSELKRQYKETAPQAGVYQVRNLVNGRVFLGSSFNLHGPFNKHRFMLKFGSHPARALQKDWNQHGPEAFAFEILAVVEQTEDPAFSIEAALQDLEARYLRELEPCGERGYNSSPHIRE